MTMPTDDELDAAVARLEPRLFMTLGARSRRRRVARILGGTAAGAGLIGAGLAIGVYLLPAPLTSAPVAIPSPGSTAPVPGGGGDGDGRGGGEKAPVASAIVCHASNGSVVARVQFAATPGDPAALCHAISPDALRLGTIGQPSDVACVGAGGSTDVYPSTSATPESVCSRHGARVAPSTK